MAHFAELDDNNVVLRVIVVNNVEITDSNGVEQESIGIKFCNDLLGGKWLQTSYNGNFRKNFAAIGSKYDEQLDAFITPQPYPSCVFDVDTCKWFCPPDDGNTYEWNAETKTWDLVTP